MKVLKLYSWQILVELFDPYWKLNVILLLDAWQYEI